jgi:hypothetical protein
MRSNRTLVMMGIVFAAAAAAAQPETLPHAPHDPVRSLGEQLPGLLEAMVRLPLAAALGGVLAFRPRRAGTPERSAVVIQTQILLAIVGAIVMLVVGQSLARAFGIVGVASLVRYRAKISDPKDAGVMLASLGIGLAMRRRAPPAGRVRDAVPDRVPLVGGVARADARAALPADRDRAEPRAPAQEPRTLLRRNRATFEMRTLSEEQLSYDVALPLDRSTDSLSSAIASLNGGYAKSVQWDEKE